MEANGLLPDVQGIEQAEEELLHVVDVIELRLHDVPIGALAIQALQDHTCMQLAECASVQNPLLGYCWT